MFQAQVRRDVEDTISLTVEAKNEDEAFGTAFKTLEIYPSAHPFEDVSYCYTENRRILDSTVGEIQLVKEL